MLNPQSLLAMTEAIAVWQLDQLEKIPYHTSRLSGAEYTTEVIESRNDRRVHDVLRMPLSTFKALVEWVMEKGLLASSKNVSIEEQLAIFLKIVGEGASNRTTQDRFRHSGETISRYFNQVLEALIQLYPEFVKPPLETIPPEISHSRKFFPFFRNCIGAADGIHVLAMVPPEDAVRFRNRKGDISQNVLGICNFNLQFSYVYPGWEGSAHDARVLEAALASDLYTPEGKYYLVDAGYGLRKGFLAPYRGIRYHLKEQGQCSQRYDVFTYLKTESSTSMLDTSTSLSAINHRNCASLPNLASGFVTSHLPESLRFNYDIN